jgi:hypothetical protein
MRASINNIHSVKKHLEPLALAACITQTAHCRLDQVFLTFGLLYYEYSQLIHENANHQEPLFAIINSLEKRWAKCDQDVFVTPFSISFPLKKGSAQIEFPP